jgi:hypothetical protein
MTNTPATTRLRIAIVSDSRCAESGAHCRSVAAKLNPVQTMRYSAAKNSAVEEIDPRDCDDTDEAEQYLFGVAALRHIE